MPPVPAPDGPDFGFSENVSGLIAFLSPPLQPTIENVNASDNPKQMSTRTINPILSFLNNREKGNKIKKRLIIIELTIRRLIKTRLFGH